MGVVYKAYDSVMNREVALKTILDVEGPVAAELFLKEWKLQASLIHPNIVEIYDVGELDEDGVMKPYFVMPLLCGRTLGQLITSASQRPTVERAIDIICQTCRGLQAAHERGLIHRDLKPNNIFVMDDDSVKIIDFGLVHTEGRKSVDGLKGTLPYMAPELLRMEAPSVLTDIFALGAVCYETLTQRRAFEGTSDAAISEAVLHHSPPPANEINKGVNELLCRVVHKAMAKQPWHRFSSAREFGETLQKALRNEPIEFFDASRVVSRVDRAAKAFERGEYHVAAEILSELEGEGHIDREIIDLHRQIEQAIRQVNIRGLLRSAQQFFEEEEFSLSLRKIQDALQMDANDENALALQNHVETRRREKKIEEWSQLAIGHLENNALAQARAAIQSLLDLKPAGTTALEMLAEVDRREKEYERLQAQKAEVYHKAVEAWQRGDVSAALARLERWMLLDRDAPESDAQRLLTSRNFYNQVHSEHDALQQAYEAAKWHLSAKDFPSALALCEQCLCKYPGHALFQALKFDIEEGRRQSLTAFIAEIDRSIDSEPDLGKRCNILDSALKLYPGELYFLRAVRVTRDKRDLVNSVIAKARLQEEQGLFEEAVAQWEMLRAIHNQYPGLDYEIDRLRRRRDSQSLSDAKSEWVRQVDRYLQSRDYGRALEAALKALAEFPEDLELTELEKIVRQRAEASAAAMTLLSEGGELCTRCCFEEGLHAMREAYAMDHGNSIIRAVFADALGSRAGALLPSDMPAAEKLIGELLDLDPDHAQGRNLRAIVLDRKREDFLSWCTEEVRRLEATGDLERARGAVQQGLATYPQDSRLVQMLAALDGAIQDLAVAQSREGEIAMTAASPPPVEPHAQPPLPSAGIPTTQPPIESCSEAPFSDALVPNAARQRDRRPIVLGLACTVLILLSAGVYKLARGRNPAAAATSMVRVELRTSPAGAVVKVDGAVRGSSNLQLDLAPGAHNIAVELEGYRPVAATVAPKKGDPMAILDLALVPLPGTLRVSSDDDGGEAWLDDRPLIAVQQGEFMDDALISGSHSVRFSNRKGKATMTFELAGGKQPVLRLPLEAKGVEVAVVHQYGSRVWAYCTCSSGRISLDNRPSRELSSSGVEWNDATAGPHELKLEDGKSERTFHTQNTPAPLITAFFFSKVEPDTGALSIFAGEENVNVYVNDNLYHRTTTQKGTLRIPNLPVAQKYILRVSKEGYESPPPQTVRLTRNPETKVTFQLKAVATMAALQIKSGPAGARVLLDGRPIGVIAEDGDFLSKVAPGSHTVELRKDTARSKPVTRSFTEGLNTLVPGPDLILVPLPGTLLLKVSPVNSRITVRLKSEQDSQARHVSQESVVLPEGSYVVSASAPGHAGSTAMVALPAGGKILVELALKRLDPVRETTPPAAFTVTDWEDPGGWTKDGQWYVHKSGSFIPYRVSPVNGRVMFEALVRKGKRLQWAVNRIDDKNYLLYKIDKKYFERSEVVNGKSKDQIKVEHNLSDQQSYKVKIDLSSTRIELSLKQSGNWVVIDNWSQPQGSLNRGRFGFIIPWRDEFAVSSFTLSPQGSSK